MTNQQPGSSPAPRTMQNQTVIRRALDILTRQGPRVLAIKVLNRLRRVNYNRLFKACRLRLAAESETESRRLAAAAAVRGEGLLFSIIVPLYNTDPEHLSAMIESVQHQEYPRWQLCLADGSDSDHPDVEATVMSYATHDPRIIFRKLAQNQGISGNTNAALAMAAGDYIALLDHDDLLAPQALAEVNDVIQQQQADLIYSDELNFTGDLDQVKLIHFKPDFAIDNLRSNNYICHLTVFAKVLADQVGRFDSACDGSQDYDYILRLAEKAKKIVHIPKILYYWRIHGRSVASDISVKPYCLDAARLALANHLHRSGLTGRVENNSILSTYRIHYPVHPDTQALVLITVRAARQLGKLLQLVSKPAGINTEYILVIPDHILPRAAGRARWLAKFQHLQPACQFTFYRHPASLAAVLNREATSSSAGYFAFLDGSVLSVSDNWLAELLMFAQRADVGAATGKIIHHGIIQQAGLATGIAGSLGAYHNQRANGEPGYMARLTFANNISVADRTCLVTSRASFEASSGFDERYMRDFFDFDLCLRMRADRKIHVFSPYAEITVDDRRSLPLHLLKKQSSPVPADLKLFNATWQTELQRPDPYYNPNFNSNHARFDQL